VWEPGIGCCVEPLGSIGGREFLNLLIDLELDKKDLAAKS